MIEKVVVFYKECLNSNKYVNLKIHLFNRKFIFNNKKNILLRMFPLDNKHFKMQYEKMVNNFICEFESQTFTFFLVSPMHTIHVYIYFSLAHKFPSISFYLFNKATLK